MFDGYIFADPGATSPEVIAGTENSIQSSGCSYDVGVVTETKHHKILKRSGEGHIEFSIIKLPHGPTGTNVHQVVITWAMDAHQATVYLLKSSCGAPCIGPCKQQRVYNAWRGILIHNIQNIDNITTEPRSLFFVEPSRQLMVHELQQ